MLTVWPITTLDPVLLSTYNSRREEEERNKNICQINDIHP